MTETITNHYIVAIDQRRANQAWQAYVESLSP